MPKSKPLDIKNQIDLPLQLKRGRGRPRKADALSNAERQRRWRQKTVVVKADVLQAVVSAATTASVASDSFSTLQIENEELRDHIHRAQYVKDELLQENVELRARIAELEAELRDVTKKVVK